MDRFKIMKPSISFLNILTNKDSYEYTIAKIFKSKPRNSMNSGISYNAQFKLLSSNPDTRWNAVIIPASSSHLSSSYLPLGVFKFIKVTYILTNPNLTNEFSSINKYINVSLQAGIYILQNIKIITWMKFKRIPFARLKIWWCKNLWVSR